MFKYLLKVNLEIFSKCNRQCKWCPNSFIQREETILNKEIFTKLIQDLYNNNFGKNEKVTFFIAGYSEPLLHPEILYDYIEIIKKIFSDRNIKIGFNTNGDYLTKEILDNLPLGEQDEIGIMDYDCRGELYWNDLLRKYDCIVKEDMTRNILRSQHKDKKYQIKLSLNWPLNTPLEDRGGSLKVENLTSYKWKNNHKLREKPCDMALKYLQIYADGNVTFCCHFHPNNENHKKYILGNLYNNSIIEIYKNPLLNEIHKKMMNCDFDEACKYCNKNVSMSQEKDDNFIQYLYYDLLKQYIQILSKYLPFSLIPIKNMVIFENSHSVWENGIKDNPYLINLKNSKQLSDDIITNGFLFPFVITPIENQYSVIEGKHKFKALIENVKEDYCAPCFIIPNRWNKYYDDTKKTVKELKINETIKILYPKKYNIRDLEVLKSLKDYNSDFYLLESNDLHQIFRCYLGLAFRLSHELYYYPKIKPMDYKEFLIKNS